MMGIVVPKTCWTYKKYNKIISGIQLVFILQLSQWCTVQQTSDSFCRQNYVLTETQQPVTWGLCSSGMLSITNMWRPQLYCSTSLKSHNLLLILTHFDQCQASSAIWIRSKQTRNAKVHWDPRFLSCTPIWRSDDHASWYVPIIKPTRCTNFSNLLWNETLHVLDSSSVHHQEFSNVHTAMVHVIHPSWSCSQAVRNTCMAYTIAVRTVLNSWWWTQELSETCRVLFQSRFEKLVYLVGFIIRTYTVSTVKLKNA